MNAWKIFNPNMEQFWFQKEIPACYSLYDEYEFDKFVTSINNKFLYSEKINFHTHITK